MNKDIKDWSIPPSNDEWTGVRRYSIKKGDSTLMQMKKTKFLLTL